MPRVFKSPPKYVLTILLSLALLIFFELALQVRSQIKYGTSVFNIAKNETTYIIDKKTGLKLLRKSATISGSEATIKTNSLGLRSPEVQIKKPNDVYRVGVVGASSVMGTYTRDNNDVFAYKLKQKLLPPPGYENIEFINAGIAGYSLAQQQQIIEKILLPLDINALVLYPGFNDLSGYCRTPSSTDMKDYRFHHLDAPKWLLSIELITKNTVWLRHLRAGGDRYIDAAAVNTNQYTRSLKKLFDTVFQTDLPMLVLTNPRAYSRSMPYSEQLELSETARYYNPCFDIDGLHTLYDRHNDIIFSMATEKGFHTYRLDQAMPHGKKFFGDASHFTAIGTDYAAELVAAELSRVWGLNKIEKKITQDNL